MGDEIVQPMSWYQGFRQGRSSMDWSLANSSSLHGKIQEYIVDLDKIYRQHPQFRYNDEQDFTMICEYGSNLIVAYHQGTSDNRRIAVIQNFSNRGFPFYDVLLPAIAVEFGCQSYSNNPIYDGSGSFQKHQIDTINSLAGEISFRLTIPLVAIIVLEEYLS